VIGVFVYCCSCASATTKEANRLFIIKTWNDNRTAVTIKFIGSLYLATNNHCLYDDPKGTSSPKTVMNNHNNICHALNAIEGQTKG
jgi:hypothetical protein